MRLRRRRNSENEVIACAERLAHELGEFSTATLSQRVGVSVTGAYLHLRDALEGRDVSGYVDAVRVARSTHGGPW